MGLFGKLFEKKTCDICGGEFGLLGGKKLQDGNCCKDCAKLLSPNFEGFKDATVLDIQNQIAARDLNRAKLSNFHETYVFGESGCILIDEENHQFVALGDTSDGLLSGNKVVTSLSEIIDKNPDIISFDQVREVRITEPGTSREEKHNVDGKMVSFKPPHMTYLQSFAVDIFLKDHPYIEHIYVPLCQAIQIKCNEPRKVTGVGGIAITSLLGCPEARIEKRERVYNTNSLLEMVFRSEYQLPDYSFGFRVTPGNRQDIQRYKAFLLMSQEIKEILEGN